MLVSLAYTVFLCSPLDHELIQQNNGKGGKGGPPAVFRLDVPESKLNVIAGVPTKNSIVLSFQSIKDGTVDLKYQADKQRALQIRFDISGGEPRHFELTNLAAAQKYTYKATLEDQTVNGTFATAKSAGQSFVFDVQADSHLDGNSDLKVYENTLNNMVSDKPDFLVDLGDTFMVDKYKNYMDSVKNYQAQRYWFSIPGSQMSVFLCLGNHDGEAGWKVKNGISTTDWAQAQREKFFPRINRNSFYSGAPVKGLYYAYTWGDAQFIVLDPFVATTQKTRTDEDGWNWTLGKEQFQWFESTLKNSKSKFKFVFLHHLVGGVGSEARGGVEGIDRYEWGGKEEFPVKRSGWTDPIHSLMVKYKVSALFHGHDHLYVRQERDGIVYLEVPQPSLSRSDSTASAEGYGYRSGKILGSSGHVRVSVDPKGAKLEYVKSRLSGRNQEVVDSVTITP